MIKTLHTKKILTSLLMSTVILSCTPSASAAPPVIDPNNTIMIKGPITGGSLDKLQTLLMQVGASPLNIVIDSPGGSVMVGSKFISYMEAAKSRGIVINCFVPNMAASMAFGILTHCDNRYALSKAFLLWHRARVMLGGMGGAPMTAPQLLTIGKDLEALDAEILRETTEALGIDADVVKYHFEAETLHLGINLHKLAPNFITTYDSIPGLLEALHNEKLPQSEASRGLFDFLFGELIYISSRLTTEGTVQ